MKKGSEEIDDIQRLLGKIPKTHADLVRGYTWHFQPGNTLKGDDEHVGYIDDLRKKIVIAAPWNYPREFTILHEIGHKVYKTLPESLKEQWSKIVKRTKHKQSQNAEELFCMAYACHYAKNKITIHDHPEWHRFIKQVVDETC